MLKYVVIIDNMKYAVNSKKEAMLLYDIMKEEMDQNHEVKIIRIRNGIKKVITDH